MSRSCAIFGGGDSVSLETVNNELVGDELMIAADSGYLLMKKLGFSPDLIIGDFDSAPEPDCQNKEVYPVEKDDTDLMLAIKHGISEGCSRFVFFGATGGRLDHTFAAVQSLAYLLDNRASGVITSDDVRIELLDPGVYSIIKKDGFTLSLLAFSEKVEGLTVSGTKYCCENICLSSSFPLGVSNSIEKSSASVSFSEGRLLVICSKL